MKSEMRQNKGTKGAVGATGAQPTSYTYTFFVWPDEARGFSRSTFAAFLMLSGRMEMEFTEEAFGQFRADLARDGLTLREIERWPHHEPESVL